MKVQSMQCPVCDKKTPHVEGLNETYLSVWYCILCGNEQRPGGNSMVLASNPSGQSGGGSNMKEISE